MEKLVEITIKWKIRCKIIQICAVSHLSIFTALYRLANSWVPSRDIYHIISALETKDGKEYSDLLVDLPVASLNMR